MIPRPKHSLLMVLMATSALCLAAPVWAANQACGEGEEARAARLSQCFGKSLSDVAITECPLSVCGVEGRRKELLSLTGLVAGEKLSDAVWNRTLKRLRETGYVRDVVPQCAQSTTGIEVGLALCSNTFVRKVYIEGNRSLHKREIKKRIFLRSGTILNLDIDDPMAHKRVQNQARSIRGLYLKEGMRLAANNCGSKSTKKRCGIRFKIERVSPTDVDITITLSEMERRRIRRIEARHLPTKGIGDLQCPTVESGDIMDLMEVSTGDVITKRRLRRITQKLTQWFQSIGFVRPLVEIRPRGEPIVLEASISTDKCWLVRVWKRPQAGRAEDLLEPTFRESDPVKGDEASKGGRTYRRTLFRQWREALGFGNSGDFEIEEASRGVSAIHQILESKGYLFADVVMEHRRIEEATGKQPVLGFIDYYITENRRRRIQGIDFQGLKSFESRVLNDIVSTKSDDVTETGFLSTGKVFADLARLKEFYQKRGFYSFRFEWQGTEQDAAPTRHFHREGDWLIWTYTYRDRGFRVRKRKGETVVYLTIKASEGPRSKVSLVQVREALNTGSVQGVGLELKDGAPYGSFYLNRDIKKLEQHYQRRGHYAVKVSVMCDARDPEPLDVCDPRRVQSGKVDVFFRVNPGPKVEVGELFWRGNYRTDPSILTRDFPKKGKPYIQAEIQDAARKLRNTGIFNSVRVIPVGLDEDPPRKQIALVVSVEESPSRFVDFAGGFRTIDRANLGRVPMMVGSAMGQSITATDRATSGQSKPYFLSIPDVLLVMEVGYLDQNFLGRGQELKVPLEYGFSTTTPLRLFQTRPRWTIRRAFNTDLTLELSTRLIYADRVSEVKDFSEYSLGAMITYPVLKSMALSAEISGGLLRFEEPDTENIFDPTEGSYDPFLRTTLRWRWDNTDNPLHPTTGFALSTALSYILDNELEGQSVISRNFLKWELTAKMAQKIPPGFILALFARYGGSDATEEAPLPTQERYTLGNSNGMRGFADDAIGRYGKDGSLLLGDPGSGFDYGGNVLINGSMELRIPLVERAGIWMVSFFDWGALAADHKEVFPASFRFSAGVGFRYLLMNQIPVRLDWGAVMGDLRCRSYDIDSIGTDSPICIANEDRTAVHFGFLYPF
jgi:outer membrane protein assembly factor BamA